MKLILALLLGVISLGCMLIAAACALVAVALIGAWLLTLIGVPITAGLALHPLLLALCCVAGTFCAFIIAAVVATAADTVL